MCRICLARLRAFFLISTDDDVRAPPHVAATPNPTTSTTRARNQVTNDLRPYEAGAGGGRSVAAVERGSIID